MDIELGIQNVARTVTFSTEQSADEVNTAIADAVENSKSEDNQKTLDSFHRRRGKACSQDWRIVASDCLQEVSCQSV